LPIAAAPYLKCNDSYFKKKTIYRNPGEMKLMKGKARAINHLSAKAVRRNKRI
jgi:hypothetical protein